MKSFASMELRLTPRAPIMGGNLRGFALKVFLIYHKVKMRTCSKRCLR